MEGVGVGGIFIWVKKRIKGILVSGWVVGSLVGFMSEKKFIG